MARGAARMSAPLSLPMTNIPPVRPQVLTKTKPLNNMSSFWKRFSTRTDKEKDWNTNADFFRFTRGRFVRNERHEMAQRQVQCNVNELCRLAGEALGTACIIVEKCPDGLYNKAFTLTMKDGRQVIAKVPNPNAGLPHLTTASEVATLDFMRTVLGTPVPQVIAWSSSNETAVGAEYIIMEKAVGVQLSSVWPALETKQRVQVIRSVARHLRTWTKTRFTQIGSLYYAEDIGATHRVGPLYVEQDTGAEVVNSRFAIGPVLSKEWTSHGRARLECDRGPWPEVESFKRATIERDLKAIDHLPSLPKSDTMIFGPGLFQPTCDRKRQAGRHALQALPYVFPKDSRARSFHLWHDDLHTENIFVREDDPTVITSIIDWQATSITPLFDHAISPAFLSYEGPRVEGLEPAPIPDIPASASVEERAAALYILDQQTLAVGFKKLLQRHIEPAFHAIMWQESLAFHFNWAIRSLLENSEAYCLAALTEFEDSPVKFSEAELADIRQAYEATEESASVMETIKTEMGDLFPEKGVVAHEEYDDAKAALRGAKAEIMKTFAVTEADREAWEKAWPYDD